jgi:hypothetical protein
MFPLRNPLINLIPETTRAVAVHSAAIIEALRKVNDALMLANEIEGKIQMSSDRSCENRPRM